MADIKLEWSPTLGDGNSMTYANAQKAIVVLGPHWRFPTVQELLSIVDYTRCNPAIDSEQFPDTKSCAYWTSTDAAWDSDPNPACRAVWVVYFSYGYSDYCYRDLNACVRAVRSVSAGQ